MSRILAVSAVLPEHVYDQERITAELAPLVTTTAAHQSALERLHAGTAIGTRHLALPLDRYRELGTFTQANELFVQLGTDLGQQALHRALTDAGVSPDEVDVLFFTSVTGVSAPSLDALLAVRAGLRPDVKRIPSFGLGCAAGAAGIARLHDYLVGHPDDVAVLLSVELCSLTLQREDESAANFVATGLFGDGASAVVMVGDGRARVASAETGGTAAATGPDVVATTCRLYPDTQDDLGWQIGQSGFRIVLSAAVPAIVAEHLGADMAAFLDAHELKLADIATWVAHPGGPRVLEACARALDLPDAALGRSWRSMQRVGNLSSSSVLHVLADVLADGDQVPGSHGVLFAFGPGVGAELVLLRWPDA